MLNDMTDNALCKFPPIEPFKTFFLPVSVDHQIYVEFCGNPEGKLALFLHGGPGSGCDAGHREYFDPKKYFIVLFDQRGCGRSRSESPLSENTTWHLVADIKKILGKTKREHFDLIVGGSWGSTLALSYAIQHPNTVKSLLIRGIFLARPCEMNWLYQEGGASEICPEKWHEFANGFSSEEKKNLLQFYAEKICEAEENTARDFAKRWCDWEGSLVKYRPSERHEPDPDFDPLVMAKVEAHYFRNNSFFETDNWILENLAPLQKAMESKTLKIDIIHSRYDMVTSYRNAWELSQALPLANMETLYDAGHAGSDAPMTQAILRNINNR